MGPAGQGTPRWAPTGAGPVRPFNPRSPYLRPVPPTEPAVALSYTLREGLSGFRRTTLATATSVSALAIALVLIGLFALLGWQWRAFSDTLRQRAAEAEVFLRPVDGPAAERVGGRLRQIPGVDSVRYVSHDEAAATFRETFGEGADLFDDEQFLPASYRVTLDGAYAQADSMNRIAARVRAWGSVEDVAYDVASVETIERNRKAFSAVGLGVALLVVVAALLLVGNTVRLSIYARRMLIRTMKLVGATNGFIRRPFLIEGAAQGLVAGAAAGLALWGLYGLLLAALHDADALGAATADWPGGSPALSLLAVVGLGVLLGFFASWIAVRRFIREVAVS